MKAVIKKLLILICAFLVQSTYAQEYLNEQFNDNRKNWKLEGTINDTDMTEIKNGKLYVTKKVGSDGTNWSYINAYFDPSEDFEIEAMFTRSSGETNHAYTLVFGVQDSKNLYRFNLAATQYYKFSIDKKDELKEIIPWVHLPDLIRPMGEPNKVLIKKADGKLKFYINDRYVNTADFEGNFGTGFGFMVEQGTVEADYLIVRGSNQQQQQVVANTNISAQLKPSYDSDVDRSVPIYRTRNDDAIAVVIGNTEYQKTKKVEFAVNDAKSMKNYLVKSLGFREGNILYLENATKGDFELLFGTANNYRGKLANTIKNGISDVFVFYSGHGAPGLNDQKGYFVPVECDPNYVELSGYGSDVFYGNLAKLDAKSVTVVLDACFSGATIFENISPIVIKTKETEVNDKITVLSSSTGSQVSSWYNDQYHGMFTYFFLDVLKNASRYDINGDRKLTLSEMYQILSDNNNGVPYWARRIHGIEQRPTLSGIAGSKVMVEF